MLGMDENSPEYKMLKDYYTYLTGVSDSFKQAINYEEFIADGSDISAAIDNIEDAEEMEARILALKASMADFMG
jgi:hypothetical protein